MGSEPPTRWSTSEQSLDLTQPGLQLASLVIAQHLCQHHSARGHLRHGRSRLVIYHTPERVGRIIDQREQPARGVLGRAGAQLVEPRLQAVLMAIGSAPELGEHPISTPSSKG